METKIEDCRTDQEKRQDAFDVFLKKAKKGTKALIIFCGDQFKVKFHSRVKMDVEIVSLDIVGNRHDFDGERLAFNVDRPDDSELVKIL